MPATSVSRAVIRPCLLLSTTLRDTSPFTFTVLYCTFYAGWIVNSSQLQLLDCTLRTIYSDSITDCLCVLHNRVRSVSFESAYEKNVKPRRWPCARRTHPLGTRQHWTCLPRNYLKINDSSTRKYSGLILAEYFWFLSSPWHLVTWPKQT